MKNLKLKSKSLSFFLSVVLILSVIGSIWLVQKSSLGQEIISSAPKIEKVSAQEIHPLFECPCCGRPISDPCCGMARERKIYIDGLTEGRLSKEEVIATYVEKYGLNSFVDKQKQKEYREKLVKQAPADRPIISLSPQSYDLGNVSPKQGIITHNFRLENQGKTDLVIDKIETSCGCTSASVVYKGEEGPKFNMPGHKVNKNNKNWEITIPPGEQAELKVYYDPNFHPDFRGEAVRSISVFSNDPVDFEKKIQIELNQVD